jgi:hypothetical protein
VKRAALLYAVLTLALAYPLSVHPGSAVLSDAPDTNLFMWTLAWDTHAFAHQPLSIFDANIYYPERHTLAYSENLIGSAFLAAPVIWLTGNLVLAMNVVALLSCVLCGAGTYLLARRLRVGAAGATIAGLIFAFSPPRFLRLDQLHLATIQWVPFALAYLHSYFIDRRPRDLRLFLAFFTLQAFTSGHGAVFLLVAAVVVAVVAQDFSPARLRQTIRDAGWVGVALLVPAALLMIPYRQVQVDIGLRRTLENWAVPIESFFASPSHVHTWILELFHASRVNDAAQAYLFPGFIAILLAVAALTPTLSSVRKLDRVRGDPRLTYGLIAVISVLMASGPPLSLWPFVYWLPGFNFVRAPSRFMLLALLAVAVLAGIGFDRLTRRAPEKRRLIAVVVGFLLVAEFATMPFELAKRHVDVPAIDRWLAGQPGVRAIAEVPLVEASHLQASELRHTTYMLHATAHWHKTVEGYSGIRPPLFEELYAKLRTFPDAASLRSLADLGVTHVVVHRDLLEADEQTAMDERLRAFGSWLRLEHADPYGRVYSLHPH